MYNDRVAINIFTLHSIVSQPKPEVDSVAHQLSQTDRLSSPRLDRQTSSMKQGSKAGGGPITTKGFIAKKACAVDNSVRELLRTLAEVHCVYAEVR